MMSPSHLAATVILGLLLARWFPFDGRAWLLALAFGVAIDIDHLFELPRYLATEFGAKGLAALTPAALLAHGPAWQGVFHNPVWGPLLVLGASIAFRSPIPLAFWGLHMVLDFVVATRFVKFGSPAEFAVLAAMLVAVGVLLVLHHRDFGGGRPLDAWARSGLASLGAAGMTFLPFRR